MAKLVLLRHGQSLWNLENIFTGWTDIDLSEKGRLEAQTAGRLLQYEKYLFDAAFCSVLLRAENTLKIALQTMNLSIPVYSDWHLNERHYGALQGMDKDNAVKQYGEDQIHKWRRGYDTPPPPLGIDDPRYPGKDPKYSDLTVNELPVTESLRNTFERVIPYWEKNIVPLVNQGERILICAHGNSLRALVKHLDDISDEDITKLEIPTGIPLVYELDERLKPLKKYYLDVKALK